MFPSGGRGYGDGDREFVNQSVVMSGKEHEVPNPSIKDEKTYRKVREQGASEEKAARIANSAAKEGRKKVAKRGGKSPAYEDMSKGDLYKQAKKVGIEGRSDMSKSELVKALRNH